MRIWFKCRESPMRNLKQIDGSVKRFYGDRFFSIKDAYTKDLGVTKSEFREMCLEFNLAVRQLIVEEGFEFSIPYGIGKLAVYKYKPEIKPRKNNPKLLTLPINPRATAELWRKSPELKGNKYVYYLNNNTDGYICKPFYTKNKDMPMGLTNLYYVMFTPVSRFNKSIKDAIDNKDAHLSYFIFDQLNLN